MNMNFEKINTLIIGTIAFLIMIPFFVLGYQLFQPEYTTILFSNFVHNFTLFLILTIVILYLVKIFRKLDIISMVLAGVLRWGFIHFIMFVPTSGQVLPNPNIMAWEFFVMVGGYVAAWKLIKDKKVRKWFQSNLGV